MDSVSSPTNAGSQVNLHGRGWLSWHKLSVSAYLWYYGSRFWAPPITADSFMKETRVNVTVPLGLWMFERPGELRLNHSNVNLYYINIIVTSNADSFSIESVHMKDTNKVYKLPLFYNRWKRTLVLLLSNNNLTLGMTVITKTWILPLNIVNVWDATYSWCYKPILMT